MGTASVAQSNVTLKFCGALDAERASDAAYYSVKVNGYAITVDSAGYDTSTHSVILSLPEGMLHSGDQVVVGWSDLIDTQQHRVTGAAQTVAH